MGDQMPVGWWLSWEQVGAVLPQQNHNLHLAICTVEVM
jgi:hypothetical protein